MGKGRIGVGIVELNPGDGWAERAHVPTLQALPSYDLVAVAPRFVGPHGEAAPKLHDGGNRGRTPPWRPRTRSSSVARWTASPWPPSIAGAVAFLAGPDAAHVSGVALNVDGGMLA